MKSNRYIYVWFNVAMLSIPAKVYEYKVISNQELSSMGIFPKITLEGVGGVRTGQAGNRRQESEYATITFT